MGVLTINGQRITARDGQTVLEAAREASIVIPTLCWHPDLSVDGSCRLCVVEVDGMSSLPAACSLPASDGMVVQTETPALIESRRFVLELLLRHYADAGYAARDRDETEFERWIRHYNVCLPDGVTPMTRDVVDSDPNPFVWVDWNK